MLARISKLPAHVKALEGLAMKKKTLKVLKTIPLGDCAGRVMRAVRMQDIGVAYLAHI